MIKHSFVLFCTASLACLVFRFSSAARVSFPHVAEWIKRSSGRNHEGCVDPTEPFQCPGTNICISLQFLCDGQPGDCPDDYDENKGLCVAAKRPPKDNIRRLLLAQFSNYGSPFIEFLFGHKAADLFKKLPHVKAIDVISMALAESSTVDDFALLMEMTNAEKKRLIVTFESLHTGKVDNLPSFIINSASEGLNTLVDQLIRTQFLDTNF